MTAKVSPKASDLLAIGRGIMRAVMPYLANVLLYEMRFKISEAALGHNGIPTACVTRTGWVLMHPEFVERVAKSPKAARIFAYIFAHEVLHPALRHGPRMRSLANTHIKVDPMLWNIAGDLSIEQILREMPALCEPDEHTGMRGVHIEDFGLPPGLTTEEYYLRLTQMAEAVRPIPGCGSGAGNPLPSESEGSETGDSEANGDPEWTDAKSEQVSKQFSTDLKAYAESTNRGTVPAGLLSEVGAALKPSVVPWRQLLRTVVIRAIQRVPGDDYSNYARQSKKGLGIGSGYGSPFIASKVEDKPRVGVVLDTSGSMHGVLPTALSEVNSILGALDASISFICCDTEATDPRVVDTVEEAEKLICGGGGTHLVPGIDKAKEDGVDVIVVLTDGYIGEVGGNPGRTAIFAVIGRPPYLRDVEQSEKDGWGVVVGIDE